MQRVGIVVRRGINYSVNPDVTGFEVDPAASCAAASTSRCSSQPPLRVLAVHLKTGCFDDRLSTSKRRACAELREQMPPLLDWIARARAEGVAFAILGDFNRHMDGRDQMWSVLRQAAPLTRATEGRASPCWGGEAFIDHIVLGDAARDWLLPEIAARPDLSRDRRGMAAAPVGSLSGVGALAPAGLTTLNAAWRKEAAA